MPTFEFTAPDGNVYEVAGPEGATQAQAWERLQSQIGAGQTPETKAPSATVSTGRAINDIPRQIGLTARYALTGPAKAAQIVTEPLRYLTDRATGMTGQTVPLGTLAGRFADRLGLPTPQNATERVVGDAAELMAGGGSLAGAARAGAALPGAAGTVLQGLAANPGAQVSSAAGAGLAGGASREAGGTGFEQGIGALVGGLTGAGTAAGLSRAADALRVMRTPAMTPGQIDAKIKVILESRGVDWAALGEPAKAALRKDAAAAMKVGTQGLNEVELARLADIRGAGMTPTRSMLTLDPVQVTREQNLAKIGASSSDPALQGLARLQGQNNMALIGRLNDLGASRGVRPEQAGATVAGAVQARAAGLRDAEKQAWDAAKSAPGYATQPIYPDALNAINRTLGEEGLMPFMNPGISRYMEAFQTGQQPFTAQAYRNLQSMLARAASAGGNEGYAASAAQRVLAGAPVSPITNPRGLDLGTAPVTKSMADALRANDAAAPQAIDLVNAARAATKRAYGYEESSPLVRTALSEARTADPARLARSFVINGTPAEARDVAQQVGPAGREIIREALANHIKTTALGKGASDETGKVSQAALNRAIDAIGRDKLKLFFTPAQLNGLESAARAASYSQVQPAGAAVNNSNSGALAVARAYDTLRGLTNRVPAAGPWLTGAIDLGVVAPFRAGMQARSASQAQDVVPLLLRGQQQRQPLTPSLLLPGAAVGSGLLSLEQ